MKKWGIIQDLFAWEINHRCHVFFHVAMGTSELSSNMQRVTREIAIKTRSETGLLFVVSPKNVKNCLAKRKEKFSPGG